MLTQETLLKFLKRRSAISVATLEREAGLPKNTLSGVISGTRNLSEKHLSALFPVVTQYGFSNEAFEKARVISIINHKGGVGKTTTTAYLGEALANKGFKVLLIDIDPQGSLSEVLNVRVGPTQVFHSLLNLDVPLAIQSVLPNLDIAPSDIELSSAEKELSNKIGGELRLKVAISKVSKNYDFILIDCPPSLNILTITAMQASNSCLITTLPEQLAYKGLVVLLERIAEVRALLNPALELDGIVFTMVKGNSIHREYKELIRQQFSNLKVFDTEIKHLIDFQKAMIDHLTISEFNKNSEAATSYENLGEEYLLSLDKRN
ncbi:Cobyrinic acid ac-diamide synthase (plasmid) [Emticicia oligotrophica DSM 17448]|uniref:Cobyrinic acid ac-diamide synthase n=1 Tax=Emticicia oligotrophica (strain DSM 17448 / CIP 109782 / MTCC 6937 / GPTSA100-15) TaxID=929562 RepID=A0ABM5N874_EMTOG|nr:ParA family protein [Emticicia oligotrophica]AFK05678.1 Cobyrinic acid ac-diamide synthase [Emticicia oligotrophica DSM 17448]